MRHPFTRLRVGHSMLAGGLFGVTAASFTGGCVRELTDLRFEALPGDAAVDTSAALDADIAVEDAAGFDAAVPDAVASERPQPDTQVQDASTSLREAGADSTNLPAVDALDAASTYEPDATVVNSDAGGSDVGGGDAGLDASVLGERWVFGAAAPFERGDAGLGLVPVFPARNQVVDGSTVEWSDAGWLLVATPDMSIGEKPSEQDLSAALAVRWDEAKLYLAVTVVDEHHVNDASGFDIWGGDSIQVAFDVGQGRLPYDWEYGFAKTSGGAVAHRWRDGDADLSTDMDFVVARHSSVTVYEVVFEARHLGLSAFPVDELRLSVAVNDNDGQQRSAALELVQGIVGTKSAEHFASADWK